MSAWWIDVLSIATMTVQLVIVVALWITSDTGVVRLIQFFNGMLAIGLFVAVSNAAETAS